jgi:hypothetical protein
MIEHMFDLVDKAIELLEKANADLAPELLASSDARKLLDRYSRVERMAAFGVAALAGKVGDVAEVAKATGTSMGAAKATVATGMVMRDADELSAAFRAGEVSLDQAAEIAKAEESSPGAAKALLKVAESQGFHVLKEKSRAIKLEAEQHRDLGQRQHEARCARSYADELGMVHVHLALEPHVGTPIVARAEAEAARLAKAHKKEDREPFERYLADAYAGLLSGAGKGRAKRPELVVLVSYEVVKRGWKDVRDGEVCKIPGVGPVPPEVARAIAKDDAVLNGLFYDGTDLRHFKRWGRHIPVEVAVALELGDPPDFDGVVCVDCGNRFRTEFDHVEPHIAGGPVSTINFDPRCRNCHLPKTERDRKAGKLTPPEP